MKSNAASPPRPQRPLEELFNAMYRGKRSFADFVSLEIADNLQRKSFSHKGKRREVVSASEKLRGCHEFIRLFLLDFLPIETDIVFSYRKGVSAYDAVERHASGRHFFTGDIADFFPSIKRRRVHSTLQAGVATGPISDLDRWLDRIVDLVCLDDELPVGFSTSPAISNAALLPFDRALRAACAERGLLYTRYSDDLVISGHDASAVAEAPTLCERCLVEEMHGEFQLNRGKTKFLNRGVKVKLLGMVLLPNGVISVDSKTKSEIEVLLFYYTRDRAKFAEFASGNEPKIEARLSGLLNYVNTVDQAYLEKLRRKFGAAVVDLFVHRSFG